MSKPPAKAATAKASGATAKSPTKAAAKTAAKHAQLTALGIIPRDAA